MQARTRPAQFAALRVIRTVVHADSDLARQALFAHLRQSRLTVRLAYSLHRQLGSSWAATWLVSVYGLVPLLTISAPRRRDARILVVAGHANARRQASRILGWIGVNEYDWVNTSSRAFVDLRGLFATARLLSGRRLRRALRIIRTLDRQHGFLVACRAAAAISWYARGKTILAECRPRAVLVSSDSNPEEAGFLGAARALRVPQVFVSHAYPTPFSPPLDFTLSILEGEAAVRAHQRKGAIRGAVVLAGLEGESAPVDPHRLARPTPVIGVFPPKAFSWETLAAIIADCRTVFHAKRVVIRWHPSMLEASRLAHVLPDLSSVVESPRTADLADVARECDWVVAAENSNVHLPVLKLGIPTVVVRGLGVYPENRADLYGFVANRIVFPPVPSLRDLDRDAFVTFFSQGWRERFKEYDAAYLRPRDAITTEVRTAVGALVEGATAAVHQ